MCCDVPGRALYNAKFPFMRGSSSFSACRTPNEKDVSLSLRYQL